MCGGYTSSGHNLRFLKTLTPTLSQRALVSTQLFGIIKTKGCNRIKLPLLLERVGVKRIKSSVYIPLIPAFSLKGEGADTCVDTYAQRESGTKASISARIEYICSEEFKTQLF